MREEFMVMLHLAGREVPDPMAIRSDYARHQHRALLPPRARRRRRCGRDAGRALDDSERGDLHATAAADDELG